MASAPVEKTNQRQVISSLAPRGRGPPNSHPVPHSQLRSDGDYPTFPPGHTCLQIQFFAVKFEQQFNFHVFIDYDRQTCNH